MALSDFDKKVLEKLKSVPKGKITTYSLLAKALGKPRAYRAVGNALNKNPNAPLVPCHRVVKSDGSLGGYASGSEKKVRLLRNEGVFVDGVKIRDFETNLYLFDK